MWEFMNGPLEAEIEVELEAEIDTEVEVEIDVEVEAEINTNQCQRYYLADGIYPEWASFVKTIPLPYSEKHKLFAKRQEVARKAVEWAFGVLQARFAILRGPAHFWKEETLANIMYACIILHNIMVEDEKDSYEVRYNDIEQYDVRDEDN
ncbi:uncharacterized protein LOC133917788 [Phragmites australis]|uniref:uncharacterized protein LOC133917788 n=1 Tax=Phragmites australis TaxID=29695 RepID=UPI002D77DDE9|nr:uncharacterized protein LOC133917788 [Phragmites australis]